MRKTGTDPWNLRAALDGDERAWDHIVDEFAANVWHWARSFGLSQLDAEDVSQTVWFTLKDRGHTIKDPARLAGWLSTTTRNAALAMARRARKEMGAEFDERLLQRSSVSAVHVRPEDFALVGDLRRRLAVAYQQLTPACQELLSLCWAGLSTAEIAETLDRKAGSVGPTRTRCMRSLRELAEIDG